MPGYQLNMDNVTCSGKSDHNSFYVYKRNYYVLYLDVNECAENGTCDQDCTDTVGSFICSCYNGYELDDNGRSCNGMYIY